MTARSATTGHTHLFAGSRLNLGSAAVHAGPLAVRFNDGVEVQAELLELDPAGYLLAVPEFVTAAGAIIPPKVWTVRDIIDDSGDQVLVLGPRTELQLEPDEG